MHEHTNGNDLIEQPHPELSERLELCATPEDIERWREAGRMRGLTLSAYVRQAARELALHPALARGALDGSWLVLATRALETLQGLVERSRLPVDVQLTLHGAAAAAAPAPAEPKKRTKLEMKHARRKKPDARSKAR